MKKPIIPQEKVKPEDCLHWDYCSAPICPLEDKIKNLNYIWYPDEEICRLKTVPKWVKTQRKIFKRYKDKDRYFTFKMLNRKFRVCRGITGLNPDIEENLQLKSWLKKHLSKPISEARRKQSIESINKARTSIGKRKKNDASLV